MYILAMVRSIEIYIFRIKNSLITHVYMLEDYSSPIKPYYLKFKMVFLNFCG